MSNHQNTVPGLDVDESTYQQQQRPDVLRGEVYFNFCDDQYRLLHNNEIIDPRSVIYHEGRDQCHYFSRNQTWKSAPLVDFPDDAAFIFIQIRTTPNSRLTTNESFILDSITACITTCIFSTISFQTC